jgi:hypothetical protein
MADMAQSLADHPGLSGAVGVRGPGAFWPGTQESAFLADLKSLTSQIAQGALQKMRESSKTGGAMGNVSDKDIALLSDSVTGLDPRLKGNKEFRNALLMVKKYAGDTKALLGGTQQSAGAATKPAKFVNGAWVDATTGQPIPTGR